MLFKVVVKNFGKLTDATVRIGKFTVFAGPNSTGKSFVSKALYSIFGAMNANHFSTVLDRQLMPLSGALYGMESDSEEGFNSDSLVAMEDAVKGLRKAAADAAVSDDADEFAAIEKALPVVREHLDSVNSVLPKLQEDANAFLDTLASAESEDVIFPTFDQNDIEELENAVSVLMEVKDWNVQKFVVEGLGIEIRRHLLQNFQVPRLASLHGDSRGWARFDIDGIGNVEIDENDIVGFDMTRSGLHQLQKYSRVLYLESPVYWRLRNPLENVRMRPWSTRMRISGVPKYFYDMSGALRESYTGETDFPAVLAKLTGAEVLGGKIAADKSGDLLFQNDRGDSYPLPLTAMGITNLGILALLIEKNLLDKNTFLFIDEPEAHLHPAWQVEMAKALFVLAEEGVNVVIATHSADILKWLELKLKESPGSGGLVALNHFSEGRVISNGGDVHEKLDAILDDLTKPYQGMFIRGLRP